MSEVKVYVKHNAEIAHRLSTLPGKCQQIHGHSLQIELWLMGPTDENGIMGGLDFGVIKKAFRQHIDTTYDHHLLLNKNDPLIAASAFTGVEPEDLYPGMHMFEGDPNIENIAKWIFNWANSEYNQPGTFRKQLRVRAQETKTNGEEV